MLEKFKYIFTVHPLKILSFEASIMSLLYFLLYMFLAHVGLMILSDLGVIIL